MTLERRRSSNGGSSICSGRSGNGSGRSVIYAKSSNGGGGGGNSTPTSGNGSNGSCNGKQQSGEGESTSNGDCSAETLRRLKMVSKTTYKLRTFEDGNGIEDAEKDLGLELMEIPASPTNYSPPPGSPGCEPPSPWQAECQISRVLEQLRTVSEVKAHLH